MIRNSRDLDLFELLVFIVIFGILAAIAIPNFIAMQDRAREGMVETNMITLKTAAMKFAELNDGNYPVAADSSAVIALMPEGKTPKNPFTLAPTEINWDGAALTQGDLGYQIDAWNNYKITGYGAHVLLPTTLHNY